MGMRSIPSDVGSANGAAVADQWRQHERDRYANAGRRTGELLAAADAWLSRYPEFVTSAGEPCHHAVMVLLHLRSKHGQGAVTRQMVARVWLRHLSVQRDIEWYVTEFLPHLRPVKINEPGEGER